MENRFSVKLSTIIEALHLTKLYFEEEMNDVEIVSANVNRPGLQIIGFFHYFDPERIQIIGKVEMTYLEKMPSQQRTKSMEMLLSKGIPAAVITRTMEPFPEMVEAAKKYQVPLFQTDEVTSRFMSELIRNLSVWLAPRVTRHGVLVEVYG